MVKTHISPKGINRGGFPQNHVAVDGDNMAVHNVDSTERRAKVLIPGCMGTAAMGIENCTCRFEKTFAEFERERYNDTVKVLRQEVKDLESENAYLNRIIKKLTKK